MIDSNCETNSTVYMLVQALTQASGFTRSSALAQVCANPAVLEIRSVM